MTAQWTEAQIAAFLEGRLVGPEADRIAAALETDPAASAVAERLAPAGPLDETLRDAFGAALAAPVPARLAAAAEPAAEPAPRRVVAFPPRPARRAWVPAALAASVALAVGLGGGLALRDPSEPAGVTVGLASASVAAALHRLPAGAEIDGLTLVGSFRDGEGRPCREFEVAGGAGAGLACRDGAAWRIVALVSAPAAEATPGSGFVPASGAAIDALSPFLDALGAGPALSPAEEQALIARGWRQ